MLQLMATYAKMLHFLQNILYSTQVSNHLATKQIDFIIMYIPPRLWKSSNLGDPYRTQHQEDGADPPFCNVNTSQSE